MVDDVFIDTGHGKLAVRDYGGQGPSVLLLHGASHNLEVWRDVVAAIDGHCRVVSADLRGHGWSALDTSFTLTDLAQDVALVSKAMQLGRPVLVGHSLGGWVALAAATPGARALITIDGPVLSNEAVFRGLNLEPDGGAGGEDLLRAKAFCGDETAWAQRLEAAGPPGSVARTVAARARLRLGDGLLHARPLPDEAIAAQRCAWEIDPAIVYARTGIPTTLVLAMTPPAVEKPERFQELRRAAAKSLMRENALLDAVWLPGGHHLPVECPAEVAEIILTAARY